MLWLASTLVAFATTEETINKKFPVQPGGAVIVDVDFGSIEVKSADDTRDVQVDVWRKITRKKSADEEAFLRDNPVQLTVESGKVVVRSRHPSRIGFSWGFNNRNEAKYVVTVPTRFDAQLRTSGGSVSVRDLTGEVKAETSGGSLRFAHLRGPVTGDTSGGSIQAEDCEGKVRIHTSGGGITVATGAGSLEGSTSGGSVTAKDFRGPVHVSTSGGSVTVENVTGPIDGSTSGGSIHASLSAPITDTVRLSTSGGGITLQVPASSAFDLDAETSAGGVSSDLPVTMQGKLERSRLKGTVNGGGKSVFLRTSAGSIRVKKS